MVTQSYRGYNLSDNASQLPNTTTPAIYVVHLEEGFHVLKILLKGKYYYHVLRGRHNELLQQDCLCEEMRMKLKVKTLYHNSKALELGAKLMPIH